MKKLTVDDKNSKYDIIIDISYNYFKDFLIKEYDSDVKVCIITDSNVGVLYLNEIKTLLKNSFNNVYNIVFEAGEKSKNLKTINDIYAKLVSYKFNRNDILIALGGGVVGDITGFVASTYMRGIDFIQLPTTLLAQVDSSIGGKTGVDFNGYKNIVGSFYKPKAVFINLNVLDTLDKKNYLSAMAEIIKHGLISNVKYINFISYNFDKIIVKNKQILEEMIYESCKIKAGVVEKDFKEQGCRVILNFGHTVGHAIEKFEYNTLSHGECVALGMVIASYISFKLDCISYTDFIFIKNLINKFNLPTQYSNIDVNSILNAMKLDKKSTKNSVKFILLNKLGNVKIDENISSELIKEGILYVKN